MTSPTPTSGNNKEEIERAYGGCRNCYGKGYATVTEYASGYDTDTDIGSPGGKVFYRQSPIKFCHCDRGEQLKKVFALAQQTAVRQALEGLKEQNVSADDLLRGSNPYDVLVVPVSAIEEAIEELKS